MDFAICGGRFALYIYRGGSRRDPLTRLGHSQSTAVGRSLLEPVIFLVHKPIAPQQCLVSGGFIELAKGRVVETNAVKHAGAYSGQHCHETDVDNFGGLFANNVHAKQTHILRAKDQLQKAVLVPDNLAARVISITSATNDVRDVFLL